VVQGRSRERRGDHIPDNEQPILNEWMRGTSPARHPYMNAARRQRTPEEEAMLARARHTYSSGIFEEEENAGKADS